MEDINPKSYHLTAFELVNPLLYIPSDKYSVTRSIFRFSAIFLWTSDFILGSLPQQNLVHRKLDQLVALWSFPIPYRGEINREFEDGLNFRTLYIHITICFFFITRSALHCKLQGQQINDFSRSGRAPNLDSQTRLGLAIGEIPNIRATHVILLY